MPDEHVLQQYEQQVLRVLGPTLRRPLEQLSDLTTILYTATAKTTRHKLPATAAQTLRGVLVEQLELLLAKPSPRSYLRGAVREGIDLGARHAAELAQVDLHASVQAPLDVRWAVDNLHRQNQDDLRAALKLAKHGRLERFGDLQTILAPVRRAATRTERAAIWTAHRAANEGVLRVADRLGASRVWVAERDACLTCLAYAGHVVGPGEHFPPGLTFGDTSTVDEPMFTPPAHPHCRCTTELWVGDENDPVGLPKALRREAQRSVAQGRGQASEPARLRALDALIQRTDLLLPKSVVRRAKERLEG